MTAPKTADYQSVAVGNIKMMLSIRGLKQSDLAAYMGKRRQNLNRMLRSGMQWTFNDMCAAADFLGVSVDTLMRSDLTQSELRGNGGSLVGGDAGRRRTGSGAIRLTLAA